MNEQDIASVFLASLKKFAAKSFKKENMIILLLLANLFKDDIHEFVVHERDRNPNGAAVVQDATVESYIASAAVNGVIEDELRNMRHSIDALTRLLTPDQTNERTVYCGINNADIGPWELSAVPENEIGLKDGDKVVIRNKDYDIHLQSAVFFVKIYRKTDPNSPDFFITSETAHSLGIEDAESRGRFTVALQHFDKNKT